MRGLDHLIVIAPSLDAGVAQVEERLGVRASEGGKHEGRGTHNALLALGEGRYLEILAPDPDAAATRGERWLGVSDRTPTRLVTWVVKSSDLDDVSARAHALGVELGEPRAGARRRPDGTVLAWRLLGVDEPRLEGLIPFFIDWGASPHPSSTAARGCELVALRAQHPDPAPLRRALTGLGLDLAVEPGPSAALIATVDCPRGVVELR